jgi:hypothetical protein
MTYPFLYTDTRDFKEIAEEMIRVSDTELLL